MISVAFFSDIRSVLNKHRYKAMLKTTKIVFYFDFLFDNNDLTQRCFEYEFVSIFGNYMC